MSNFLLKNFESSFIISDYETGFSSPQWKNWCHKSIIWVVIFITLKQFSKKLKVLVLFLPTKKIVRFSYFVAKFLPINHVISKFDNLKQSGL